MISHVYSSGVLLRSPFTSPSCDAINDMFFVISPKSLNSSTASVFDQYLNHDSLCVVKIYTAHTIPRVSLSSHTSYVI